jgi:release factor glutamine methyltransferase
VTSEAPEKAPATPAAPPTRTVLELLTLTTEFFKRNKVEGPRLEAELLLAHVLRIPRIQLYVRFDQPLEPDEVDAFRELVRRRGRHEPVHYILGRREFWSLELHVERGVLIPRPDTECLVEEALALSAVHPHTRAAEVGIGSGAIAVALLTELPGLTVHASDIAETPLRVSRLNAERHRVADRLHLVQGAGLGPLADAGPFDLVVSNPPYIRRADYDRLEPHIREWEPAEALVSGDDGLDCIRALLAELSPKTLAPGGALLLEIGDAEQAAFIAARLTPTFAEVRVRKDYAGHERVVVARGYRSPHAP